MPIVYSSTKRGFINDVLGGYVDTKILASFVKEMGHSTSHQEQNSWRNSMQYMKNVIDDSEIPEDSGIAIEYKIPQTSKRIDFIVTGKNNDRRQTAIIIELKQWSEGVRITEKDGIVDTDFYGETNHPSYQAWSYKTLLEDYNGGVEDNNISLVPCAYLHNYERDDVIGNSFYKEYTEKARVFFKNDLIELQSFIKKYVKYGDEGETLYAIENGKIRPSKSLVDNIAFMLSESQKRQEFILIDDQKIVYETALKLAKESTEKNKNVLIVEGGPGTGKSVVAINLLAELTKRKQIAHYITKNSAPRRVYQIKLTGKFTQTRIANLFWSSDSFYNIDSNELDSSIVDEAHRLARKGGYMGNLGENQIKEIINASKFTIFFIDEDQRVTLKDIGRKSEIIKRAEEFGAKVYNLELASQFRCNGSDGYLAWIDDILQIRETANEDIKDIDYDFQVMDSPKSMHRKIICKNESNNKSRMVAGYCWNWISQKKIELKDIIIGDYAATWNLKKHGQEWLIHPESVTEVGCIHTCQGLELDYVGVIIGPDLIVRNGEVITDATKRASTDQSMKGIKKMLKENPEEAKKIADMIIKNTYRTLMTRGMKGCYIYCTDLETQEYFRNHLKSVTQKDIFYGNNSSGASFNVDKPKT